MSNLIKKKEILFIGRLVPEKGSHLFVKAIRNIVKNYLDWNFTIIGTAKAGQNKLITNYEKKVIDEFKALGKNTSYLGFVKNIEVQEILKSASISLPLSEKISHIFSIESTRVEVLILFKFLKE